MFALKLMGMASPTIRETVGALRLDGQPLCVHASLQSFVQKIEGGADGIVDVLLEAGCTVLVPTFSHSAFGVPPPPNLRPSRNGWDYSRDKGPGTTEVYSPQTDALDGYMGALPASVLARSDRARGNHPLNSFAAVGPMADRLIDPQAPLEVYAPLEALATSGGTVLLIGVGLDSLTQLHLAERRAGRTLFRRWANGPDGRPIAVETGGCSRGFPRLEPIIGALSHECYVGRSRWRAFPAAETVEAAAENQPARHTHSDDPHPILTCLLRHMINERAQPLYEGTCLSPAEEEQFSPKAENR